MSPGHVTLLVLAKQRGLRVRGALEGEVRQFWMVRKRLQKDRGVLNAACCSPSRSDLCDCLFEAFDSSNREEILYCLNSSCGVSSALFPSFSFQKCPKLHFSSVLKTLPEGSQTRPLARSVMSCPSLVRDEFSYQVGAEEIFCVLNDRVEHSGEKQRGREFLARARRSVRGRRSSCCLLVYSRLAC